MGSKIFSREKEEEKVHKRAILDKKRKTFVNNIFIGFLAFGTIIGTILTGGIVLLIDGGITVFYIITNISLAIYDQITKKYMQYIPNAKKRDFILDIHNFYHNILTDIVNDNDNNPIKTFINQFIFEEKILEKTSNIFEQKRGKMINQSKESKKNLIFLS